MPYGINQMPWHGPISECHLQKSFTSLFSWLARTDPHDVARVESKTFICTETKSDTIPTPKGDAKGRVGQWIAPEKLKEEMGKRLPKCMTGMWYIKRNGF
jgi:GTP-dependent phosphoenolpyruvate carboxykinase